MKVLPLFVGIFFFLPLTFGQFNTPWYQNLSNELTGNYLGIGTQITNSSSVNAANFNLHLHGTANHSVTYSNDPTMLIPPSSPYYNIPDLPENSVTVHYGKTTRIGMTNTTTGTTQLDGTVFQMSENDMFIANQENGILKLSVPGLGFQLSSATQRIGIGNYGTTAELGKLTMSVANDNGIYVRNHTSGKYGISLNVRANANAIEVRNTEQLENGQFKLNFKVTSTGEVFARKYTTTLNNIPDYVFADDYHLMTFSELRAYVQNEKHLPNVPSAKEYEANGVDLGEMNRILLEKVEELTLYVLQLEERLQKVEGEE